MEPLGQLNGQERRRYERWPVKIQAKIHSELLPISDCEIRDFCEGGLYLALSNPSNVPRSLIQSKPALSVSFNIHIDGTQETLTVKVKPVRLTSAGFGVSFLQSSAKVLRILRDIAHANPIQQSSGQLHHALNPQIRSDIKTSCEQAINSTVPLLLNEFFKELEPGLNSAAEQAPSNAVSDGYFEALATLKEQRPSFEQSYCKSIQHHFEEKNTTPAKSIGTVPDQLAVVDKDEFEDWLTLSDVINKTSSSHDAVLSDIENKLATLDNQPIDEMTNPVSPAVFCEALRDQLDGFDLDHEAKQQIYKIFGNSLDHQLDGLYSDLTQRLEPIKNNQPASIPKAVDKSTQKPDQAERNETQSLDFARHKHPPLIDTFKRFLQLDSAANVPPLNNLSNPFEHTETANLSSISECNSQQILAALRLLAPSQNIERDELESTILNRLREPDSPIASSSAEERTYIDFAAKFCDILSYQSADLKVAQSITEKLRVPLLNLAARDPEFINDPEHIAWQILDMIGRLNASLTDQDANNGYEIRDTLDQIVDEFGANTSVDSTVFDSIKNKLEHIVDPLESAKTKTVERIRENCTGKHQTEKVKAHIHSLIDQRIEGKWVPEIVISLLDGGWEHLLILSMLRHGAESEELTDRLNIFDTLLQFLSDSDDTESLSINDSRTLLNRIDEELAMVCSDFFQHRKIIDDISAHLIGAGQPPVRAEPKMVLAEPRSAGLKKNNDTEIPEYLSIYTDQVLELRVGDWLMFNMRGAKPEPLNLVWIGEDPWSFAFVNRKGQKTNELSLQSLATFFKHELAWKIESLDVPLSERTFSTVLQDMHHKLIRQSTVDERSGLINRKEFDKQLRQDLETLKDDAANHYLCNFEIDQIRLIERSCGIDAIESVVKDLIDRINPILEKHDLFAQLGDQHFGILYKFRSKSQLDKVCQNLRDAIAEYTFQWEEESYRLGVSIGVTPFVKQPKGISGLLAQADSACTAAKNAGKNQILIYGEDAEEFKIQDRIYEWAGQISSIIDQDRLFLRCQLIDLLNATKEHRPHYEILLGIKDADGNIISPEDFIPAAEHCGRISEVDRWVVNQVFEWMVSNPEKTNAIDGFSINLSGHSVVSSEFLDFTKQQLTKKQINPEKITFEVTETAAISHLCRAQKFISQIRRYGCKFSLDDFGSGYSSYAYLKNLDVDYLKIDGVFVKDLAINTVDFAMVKSMNEIGHSLNMETIAEYVEDDAILQKLSEIGVDYAQGYGVQKPILLTDL